MISFDRPFRRGRLASAAVTALLLNVLMGGFVPRAAAAAAVPQGFVDELYVSGIGRPTAMEFAPDGRLFVLEQTGRVRVVTAGGALLAAPFATLVVDSSGERGLLGIAFDPSFAKNRYVYLYYTVPGSPSHNRVSRFTANGDTVLAGSEKVILDLDPLGAATFHNGGTIRFGSDGKLYVAVGENTVSANAQSLTTRLGKMLRINADGTIPADNPATFPGIAGSTSGVYRSIWAVGFRNPFKFAVQPTTGKWFINDVGENTWEEINSGARGVNYGWPLAEGVSSNPNLKNPVFAYRHSGGTPSGCAVTGGAFYDPPDGRFTVRGSGAGIGNTADSFHYVYRGISGDGSISARISGMTNTAAAATAGVMFRAATGANAPNVFMNLTPTSGAFMAFRSVAGAATGNSTGPAVTTPYWVRLTRSGSTISGAVSPDGNSWTTVGSQSIAMAANILVGFAVSSANNQAINTAGFDHVALSSGGVGSGWSEADIGAPSLAGGYSFSQQQFPEVYRGDYFFADYCNGWIYTLDSANPASVSSFASGLTYAVDLQSGPDGSLYYLSYGAAAVSRIRYTGQATQNLVVSTNALDVNEGQSGGFTVRLAQAPATSVSVSIARSQGPAGVSLSPTTLSFNATNWNVPQTVQVIPALDADVYDDGATLSVSSAGLAAQTVVLNSVDTGRAAGAPRAIIALARNGDVVQGKNAEFFGNGYDTGPVVRAEFYADNTLVYTDVNSVGHYHFGGDHNQWNTTVLSNGVHSLIMRVVDAQGLAGGHRINVLVSNAGVSNVSIFFSRSAARTNGVSLDGARVSAPLYVYTTPDSGVARMEFWLDNPNPSSPTGAATRVENLAPYDLNGTALDGSANPLSLGLGTHSVTVRATMTSGEVKPFVSSQFTIQ
ncbi:MAG: PQQ-dependent sugar dehydrogenase [Methylotetracoccus sp.]